MRLGARGIARPSTGIMPPRGVPSSRANDARAVGPACGPQTPLTTAGLDADVVEADLFSFAPAAPFEAVYEQTCLCALTPGRWTEYEQRLHGWLVPGGRLAVAFMQTDAAEGPPFACRPEAMRRLFAADRGEWPADLVPEPHPLGLAELTGILRRRG